MKHRLPVVGLARAAGSAGSGAGGSASVLPFPTRACLDRANALLAQMTQDEKAAQTIQAERGWARASRTSCFATSRRAASYR